MTPSIAGSEIHGDDEERLLAKTTDASYADLRDRVVDRHPLHVPCIKRFDEDDLLGTLADWGDDSNEE